MKIKKGDKLEEISLPEINGDVYHLSDTRGKKVLLTFYRVAGCSFCNLRLMELKKKFNEFGKNFIHVAIFHSPIDNLRRTMKRHDTLPFKILADENFKYFKKYEVERSYSKLFATLLFKGHRVFPALLKGFLPIPIKGHFDIAITDILLDEKGIVEEVYYAKKDSADHFEFEKIKVFSQ